MTEPASVPEHVPVPTIAQTVCLLALSRGERPWLPVTTRRALLRERWIQPSTAREPGSKGPQRYDVTDMGRQALARSPHVEAAQKTLDQGKRPGRGPWKPDLRAGQSRSR